MLLEQLELKQVEHEVCTQEPGEETTANQLALQPVSRELA